MASRSSKPASPATSWKRNHFICSTVAVMASHGKSGSPWPGAAVLKLLEPGDKAIGVRGDCIGERRDFAPQRFDEFDLRARYDLFRDEIAMPRLFGQVRPKSQGIVLRQLTLKFRKARTIEVACPAGPSDLRAAHLNLRKEFARY